MEYTCNLNCSCHILAALRKTYCFSTTFSMNELIHELIAADRDVTVGCFIVLSLNLNQMS